MKFTGTLFLLLLQYVSFGQRNATTVSQKESSSSIAPEATEITSCLVFSQTANFPGGIEALMAFINRNLVYPKAQNLPKGEVIVGFCVQKDGSLTDIEILQSLEKRLDQSAINVMKKVPKWYPEIIYGRPMEVQYALPISFNKR